MGCGVSALGQPTTKQRNNASENAPRLPEVKHVIEDSFGNIKEDARDGPLRDLAKGLLVKQAEASSAIATHEIGSIDDQVRLRDPPTEPDEAPTKTSVEDACSGDDQVRPQEFVDKLRAVFRRYEAREFISLLRQKHISHRRLDAAIRIQAAFRRHCAYRLSVSVLAKATCKRYVIVGKSQVYECIARQKVEQATHLIQVAFRSRKRRERAKQIDQKLRAAIVIQSEWRKHCIQNNWLLACQEQNTSVMCQDQTTSVPLAKHGSAAHRHLSALQYSQDQATIQIQCAYRGYLVRKLKATQALAVSKLQIVFRKHKQKQLQREAVIKAKTFNSESQHDVATRMQSSSTLSSSFDLAKVAVGRRGHIQAVDRCPEYLKPLRRGTEQFDQSLKTVDAAKARRKVPIGSTPRYMQPLQRSTEASKIKREKDQASIQSPSSSPSLQRSSTCKKAALNLHRNASAPLLPSSPQTQTKMSKSSSEDKLTVGRSVCPFMELSRSGLRHLVDAREYTASDCVFDVGCGKGNVMDAILQRYPCHGVAVEVNPSLARVAKQRLQHHGDRVEVLVEDVCNISLQRATAVVTFFPTNALLQVKDCLGSNLRPGCIWLNYAYAVPGWLATRPANDGVHMYVIGEHLPSADDGGVDDKIRLENSAFTSAICMSKQSGEE